jgi:hypothetical protein
MIADWRHRFNQTWTPARYERMQALLAEACGNPIPFRLCETPLFIEKSRMQEMSRFGRDMALQLCGDARYLQLARQQIPAEFHVPGETAKPLFLCVDFGLVPTAHGYEPKLVEIQGFPSLYAFQTQLARSYQEAYGLPQELPFLLSDLSLHEYYVMMREALLGQHRPENVVLLEIDPWGQKTVCDFVLTKQIFGVEPVCITKVQREGRQLFYDREGRRTPIHRIYNRVIVDELQRRNVQSAFRFSDDVDVEWAGHPNWYYLISKFSIPFLQHSAVPGTTFLHQLKEIPADPENYVLKPLYSFAGVGVTVGPTREQIAAVEKPEEWILQQRMQFAPIVATPHGPTVAEIRIMYLWSGDLPVAVNSIVRMGRGRMMGVDYNKNLEWVGASAAFYI